MPSSTSSSDTQGPAAAGHRLWLSLFAAGFLLVVALLALSILTPAPYGDLTRIGALSESQFGWRGEQPVIAPDLLQSVALAQADVLVVGDSFSVSAGSTPRSGLLWQSQLVAAGWRVASMHWDRAYPLCPDFHEWLTSQGFRGRWVVLESVEHAVVHRLTTKSRRCGSIARAVPQAFTLAAPASRPPAPQLNLGEQVLTGVSTWWNTWRARQVTAPALFSDPSASDHVRVHPYPAGCQRFSHAACHLALFLLDEELNPPLEDRHLAMMAIEVKRSHAWRTAWVIVPNKRTYYLAPAALGKVSAALQAQGLGPDVLAALSTDAASTRDVYFPNDTHLSPRGALLLGEAVAEWLAQQQR